MEVGPQLVHGSWSEYEAQLRRVLKAVYQMLCSLVPKLRSHIVKWFTDNQNATRIVQSGSKRMIIQGAYIYIYP